jgi:hypothetical protein
LTIVGVILIMTGPSGVPGEFGREFRLPKMEAGVAGSRRYLIPELLF